MFSSRLSVIILMIMNALCSCAPAKESHEQSFSQVVKNPMPPEKAGELIEKTGGNWLFGQGVGETALTVGTCVLFPPYVLYVVGNAGLSLAGYERVTLISALPHESEAEATTVYDGITEMPGRVFSVFAGENFRTKEYVQNDMNTFLSSNNVNTQEKKWD